MEKKIRLQRLLFVFILGFAGKAALAQSIFTNPITGTNPNTSDPYIIGESFDPNITVSGIGRGAGITGTPANDRYNATGWNSATFDVDNYFEFTLQSNSGAVINFLSFVYVSQASGTGPINFSFRSSLDGFMADIGTPSATGTTINLSAAAYQGITAPITFRIYGWGASSPAGTFSINDFIFNGAVSPITPKYYRSQNSGDWNDITTWQFSADNSTWFNSTLVPGFTEKTITIRAGHTVTISTPVSLDETTITGTLLLLTGGTLTINNGAGNDIDILSNGILQVLSTEDYGSAIIGSTSVINVAGGGKIEIGDGIVSVGKEYETFATTNVSRWNDASEFEWNSPTSNIFKFSGNIYFINIAAGAIPKFIVRDVGGPIGASGDVTVNGLFIVDANVFIQGSGKKNFRDGISGNSTLALDASNGICSITSATSEISGDLVLILDKDLHINTGTTITSGSTITVSNSSLQGLVRDAGNIIIDANAKLDMGSSAMITNTSPGSVTIKGTLVTASAGGLMGIGATISAGSVVILNPGSTIEYNANGSQIIQGATLPPYYNVTFSGSGTKTLISNNNTVGTITVSGSAIFDGGNSTFGIVGTNLTMTGTSRYITGGAATKPDAGGMYNLGANTTIEFALTSGTIIRLGLIPINYANIVVSGTNVSNVSTVTGIAFQSGGSFTVKTGATFKLENINGFTGSASTAIKNANNPTCNLEAGSTIEYIGTTNQIITNLIPYENFILAGSGIKTAPAGVLTIKGNFTKSGTSTFAHNGGAVLLDGAGLQSFAALTYNDLILSNNIKTTSGNTTIIDSIKISTGTTLSIRASDTITLHSDAIKTARMAQMDGIINYNTTGKFVVERYISAKKAWRFLSAPVNSSQTIKNAWQEGAITSGSNPAPGFGTQITSNRGSWMADGFDAFSVNGPSMKTYDPVTNNYIGIATTISSFVPALGGYMTFIRGDRLAVAFGSPVSSTVLRSTGKLFTGNQPVINVISGEIIPVNNPYASALDLRNISASFNVFYYVWDPNRGGTRGLGAFQTLSWNGIDYDVIPGNSGSYGATNNFIESGQAFFVSTLGAGTTLQLQEIAKSSATFPVSPFRVATVSNQRLRTDLYTENPGEPTLLADGVINDFGNYSREVDGMDAKKFSNFSDNLAIRSGGKLLAMERRPVITGHDTVLLDLPGVKVQAYRFEFVADKLNSPGLTGILEDNYTHIKTVLDLNGVSTVNFTVNNDTGSYARDRFKIVFATQVLLPVSFTSFKAYRNKKNIDVEWKVENERNIKQYEVERSTDGRLFSTIAMISATRNNGNSATYFRTDNRPLEGYNYYRIKNQDINGSAKYTNIVKVLTGNGKCDIMVYPNPITNNTLRLEFNNKPAGMYGIRLINGSGQVFISKRINHDENNNTELIKCSYNLPHGWFQVLVTKPDGKIKDIPIMY